MKKMRLLFISLILGCLLLTGCNNASGATADSDDAVSTTTEENESDDTDEAIEDSFEVDLMEGSSIADYEDIFTQCDKMVIDLITINNISEQKTYLAMDKIIEDEIFLTAGYITDNNVKLDFIFGKKTRELVTIKLEGSGDRNVEFAYLTGSILFLEELGLSSEDINSISDDFNNKETITDVDACFVSNKYYDDPETYELTIKN